MLKSESFALLMRTIAQIKATGKLPKGWNYGRGCASNAPARENATLAANLLFAIGVDDIAVFPDSDGGVMVTGYRGEESFEILALPEFGFETMFETAGNVDNIVSIENFDMLRDCLGAKGWQEKRISASFLQNITTNANVDTIGLHSRTLVAEVFPSSISPALQQHLVVYADTSKDSIPDDFRVRPQHSGASAPKKSRRKVNSFSAHRHLETNVITI